MSRDSSEDCGVSTSDAGAGMEGPETESFKFRQCRDGNNRVELSSETTIQFLKLQLHYKKADEPVKFCV